MLNYLQLSKPVGWSETNMKQPTVAFVLSFLTQPIEAPLDAEKSIFFIIIQILQKGELLAQKSICVHQSIEQKRYCSHGY